MSNPKSKNDIIRAVKAQFEGTGTLEAVYVAAGIDIAGAPATDAS